MCWWHELRCYAYASFALHFHFLVIRSTILCVTSEAFAFMGFPKGLPSWRASLATRCNSYRTRLTLPDNQRLNGTKRHYAHTGDGLIILKNKLANNAKSRDF